VYGGHVRFAREPREFADAIVEAYRTDTQEKKAARRTFAVEHSAAVRAEQRMSHLRDLLRPR
jgi:hypothetical protein